MKSLSIVLATRQRPGLLVRTVETTLKNVTLASTRLLICADEDDEVTASVRSKITDPRVIWSVKPREESLGAKYNRVLTEAPADAYLVMVDYGPIVTPKFDEIMLDGARVYDDGYAFLLGHLVCAVDPKQPGNVTFAQTNGMTDKLARALGGIYPEIFPYWFVDHWLEDMSMLTGRRVFVDIVADCQKRPGTMDMREPEYWGNIFDWLYVERERVAAALIDRPDFNETSSRKLALKRNAPWVHERTFWINKQLHGLPVGNIDDERYLRIRKRAYDMMPEEARSGRAVA